MANHNRIDWPVESMRHWYEIDGLSVTEIARMLGYSGDRLKLGAKLVWKVTKKHGFRMRPVGANPGPKNPAWKGGRIHDKSGYVLIWSPHHPAANSGGYVREHRLVVEKSLGRYLTDTEVVHHIDEDPSNNNLDNLVVYETNGMHLAETLKGKIPEWTEDGKRRIAEGVRKACAKRRLRKARGDGV